MVQVVDPSDDFSTDLTAIAAIDAVPNILDVACKITGLGFAAVARVTEDRWIAMAVRDLIGFGLTPGDELQVETTICDEIRRSGEAVIIDHVAVDPSFKDHPTPRLYGFESYISVPIVLRDGEFFGTLCAIDPSPAKVNEPSTIKTFELFAELLALHLENRERVRSTAVALLDERRTAEMREQFIAVLGHDLRNPLAAIAAGTVLLGKMPLDGPAHKVVGLMRESCKRMTELTHNILDFARGKLGGGVPLRASEERDLGPTLEHVIDELRAVHSEHRIELELDLQGEVYCDPARLAQLLSNLVANALTHGSLKEPVRVQIADDGRDLNIVVSNGGEKIPPKVLRGLFHPFARGSADAKDGIGLGLYISSEIAKAHGGTLSVTSDDEQTVFTARLPSKRQEVEAAA